MNEKVKHGVTIMTMQHKTVNEKDLICDQPGELMKQTLLLLEERAISTDIIAKDTALPFFWLRKFRQGHTPNPSVNRIEVLYKYLIRSNTLEEAFSDKT